MVLSGSLLKQLLCLINLGRQIRTPASIGVVEQHKLPVFLADNVARDASFPDTKQTPFLSASQPEGFSREGGMEGEGSNIRRLEDQSGFSPRHFGLEPAFVKGFAHGVYGAAGATEGDEAGATL